MTGAFLYLTFWSIRNGLRVRLRRLKQPRYLIGTVVGVLYFYFFVFGGLRSGRPGGPPSLSTLLARAGTSLEFVGALALLLVAALAWAWPGKSSAIAFTRAEVHFLFTAPVTRQQLLHFKLLRSQLGALFGSVFITLIFRPGSLAAGAMFVAGFWVLSTALSLHFIGVAFTRDSLAKYGTRGLSRQRIPLIVIAAAVIAVVSAIAPNWPRIVAIPTAPEMFAELQRVTSTGPAGIVLWPFRALVRVPLAGSVQAFLSALPWALLVIVLNYVWVLRADTAFEEASAEHAEKIAKTPPGRARPVVRKTKGTPFKLAASGPPETAILWKNLILVGRYVSLKLLFRLLPLIVVFSVMLTRGANREGVGRIAAVFCLTFGTITLLFGAQFARNDLRQDLASLPLLKTWPVRGAALVRGEILAPTAMLTGMVWLFVIGAAVMFGSVAGARGGEAALILNRVSYAAVALLLAPGIIAVQVLAQNGFAVLFPAWVTVGPARGRGIESMGQRMVLMFASLLALVVLVLPAALVVTVAGFASWWLLRYIPIVPLAALGAIMLVAECWVVTELLGAVLDRTDVSAVEVTE